jgi:hypothetical protein
MSDCPFCDREKAIIAVKPERDPPRLLTDTTEGIHPRFAKSYMRTMTVLMESGELRLMRLPVNTYDKIMTAALELRMINTQRARATRFRRRMRSIRATLNRVRF